MSGEVSLVIDEFGFLCTWNRVSDREKFGLDPAHLCDVMVMLGLEVVFFCL